MFNNNADGASFVERAIEIITNENRVDSVKERLEPLISEFLKLDAERLSRILSNRMLWNKCAIFFAISSEQHAFSMTESNPQKLKLFNQAIYLYAQFKDVSSAKKCAHEIQKLSPYQFLLCQAENTSNQKENPLYCAVLYETVCLMIMEHEHSSKDNMINFSKKAAYWYAIVNDESNATQMAKIFLKNSSIEAVTNEADTPSIVEPNPLYSAILYNLSKNALLSRGYQRRDVRYDMLMNYYKCTLQYYALANQFQKLKSLILALHFVDSTLKIIHDVLEDTVAASKFPLLVTAFQELSAEYSQASAYNA